MTKLIYIQVSYDTAIVLPIECIHIIPSIQLLKTDGYNTGDNPIIHPELKLAFKLIDSSDIGLKSRKEQSIKDLEQNLESITNQLTFLKETK